MIKLSPVGKGCKQSRNHLKREKEKKQKKNNGKEFYGSRAQSVSGKNTSLTRV